MFTDTRNHATQRVEFLTIEPVHDATQSLAHCSTHSLNKESAPQ